MLNEKIKSKIQKCTLCGICLAVCPTYQESNLEKHSCRGRINLARAIIQNDSFKNYNLILDIFDTCILCGKCNEVCPQKISPLSIILNMISESHVDSKNIFHLRNLLKNIDRNHFVKDYLFFLLRNHRRLRKLKADKLFYKILGIENKIMLPDLANKHFFQLKERQRITGYPKEKIIFYLGCLGKYYFPEICDTVTGKLREFNIQVSIPKEQTCCGFFNISNSNLRQGSKQLKTLISYLNKRSSEASAIVTLCSSCERMLKGKVVDLNKRDKVKLPVYNLESYLELKEIPYNSEKILKNIGESGLFKTRKNKIGNLYAEDVDHEQIVLCSDLMVYYILKAYFSSLKVKFILE